MSEKPDIEKCAKKIHEHMVNIVRYLQDIDHNFEVTLRLNGKLVESIYRGCRCPPDNLVERINEARNIEHE